ncbi:hypothetical protein [Robertmurraya sp. P23]|uniref:hypothetical protein n=1 Tax=Robertmurraya sp. P23 TaxID=3436931 RepID=UPI003D971F90
MIRMKFLSLFILSLIICTVGCSNNSQHENARDELSDQKIIQGRILTIHSKGVFLELMGDSKNISDTIRVSVEDEKMLDNLVEEKDILVWYDYIRESNPPQTRGLKIEHFNGYE